MIWLRNKLNSLTEWYMKKATDTLDFALKVFVAALFFYTLVWVSVFVYVLFYYTYVPSLEHVKTANLQFE